MSIENEIQAKGLTAPRVTPSDIEANIAAEYFFTAHDGAMGAYQRTGMNSDQPDHCSLGLLTFCVLVLKNGFTVTGESACASPENFDAEIGRKVARQNAVAKIWALEGYLLKQRLADEAEFETKGGGDVTVQLKPGDLVRLKSGGPDMTVESISGDNALCSWYNKTFSDRANFNIATLVFAR